MAVYIAMLRGINVGPYKRMKMDQLRASFEALHFTRVATYIQSGNVVFSAGKLPTSVLSKMIEAKLLESFGFPVPVISRSRKEMERVIHGNTFLNARGFDPSKLHVSFLPQAPAAPARRELEKLTTPPDRSHCTDKEIYLYLPNGVSKSSLVNNPMERRLLGATMRNWRTVIALGEIAAGYK